MVSGYRRDYAAHLDKMKDEGILFKKEHPTKSRRTTVCYSLTNKAFEAEQLKILGIDEKAKRQKSLYKLLIFFEEFKSKEILTERQLYRFLRQIGGSKNSLKEIKASDAYIMFQPIKGVEIVKLLRNDSNADSYTGSQYYIKIPGVTVAEFVLYLKKLKKGKDPRPFSYYRGITDVPFVLFTKYTK